MGNGFSVVSTGPDSRVDGSFVISKGNFSGNGFNVVTSSKGSLVIREVDVFGERYLVGNDFKVVAPVESVLVIDCEDIILGGCFENNWSSVLRNVDCSVNLVGIGDNFVTLWELTLTNLLFFGVLGIFTGKVLNVVEFGVKFSVKSCNVVESGFNVVELGVKFPNVVELWANFVGKCSIFVEIWANLVGK